MAVNVNLDVPLSWRDLTQAQLKYVFALIAMKFSFDEIKTYCLFRWNKIEVVEKKGLTYLLKQKEQTFCASAFIIQSATDALAYIEDFSEYPVCLHRIGKHQALEASFNGVPFKKYLYCDNLYQGYLYTKNENLLDQMAQTLYSASTTFVLKDHERINIFYWWSSLKKFFALEYPNFFRTVPASGEFLPKQVKDAMNTQIRALTKGDITKEKEILATDTRRALTELDALAKEYEDLERKYPKNGK